MRSDVTIIFNARQSLELVVEIEPGGQASVDARDWFDLTWVDLDCEPLRASGKVLLLDKILGVAREMGYATLSKDADQAQEFAIQTALALEKPRVTVDLPNLSVGF